MKQSLLLSLLLLIPFFMFGQRTSIGLYYGTSIGYNAVYPSSNQCGGLFDFKLKSEESFLQSLLMINDNDLSNNNELINGVLIGVKASLPIVSGISIQPEIQFQKLDFNHIVYQNGSGVFNDITFGVANLYDNETYKIANYFWRVNYLNFPFVIKLYPTNNLFFELGVKFGFITIAEQSSVLANFDLDGNYLKYEMQSNEALYDFFDSNSLVGNHGFDTNEWPFNWNTAGLFGLGFEGKFLSFSIRYNLGLSDFFREINTKDDDFFDNYNTDFDGDVYNSFESLSSILNNNFKLRSLHITIGCYISN